MTDEMTGDEWYQTAWTQDELLQQYRNEALNDVQREDAFFNYWFRRIEDEKDHPLSDAEMTELISYHKWWGPFGELVGRLADQNRLSEEDCDRILDLVPERSYAGRTLRDCKRKNITN